MDGKSFTRGILLVVLGVFVLVLYGDNVLDSV